MTHKYTKEQIVEVLKCAKDPVYFISNYIEVVHPAKGHVTCNLDNHPLQKELVEFYHSNKFCLSSIHRQSGQTSMIAGYFLWQALFHNDIRILISAPKLASVKEIIYLIKDMYSRLPSWLSLDLDKSETNKVSIGFANGSRIFAQNISPHTGKGYSLSILYVDNIALLSDSEQENFFKTVYPCLIGAGSRFIINTIPSQNDDFINKLYHESLNGRNNVAVKHVPLSDDDPRAETFKALLSKEAYEIEFECKWVKNVT